MSIKLGKYSFSGPVTSKDKIKEWSGVYAIVCKAVGEFFLIDIGEGSKLRTRIENHCKKDCWIENCNGQLTIDNICPLYSIFKKIGEKTYRTGIESIISA